jgi:hypothetical protein
MMLTALMHNSTAGHVKRTKILSYFYLLNDINRTKPTHATLTTFDNNLWIWGDHVRLRMVTIVNRTPQKYRSKGRGIHIHVRT